MRSNDIPPPYVRAARRRPRVARSSRPRPRSVECASERGRRARHQPFRAPPATVGRTGRDPAGPPRTVKGTPTRFVHRGHLGMVPIQFSFDSESPENRQYIHTLRGEAMAKEQMRILLPIVFAIPGTAKNKRPRVRRIIHSPYSDDAFFFTRSEDNAKSATARNIGIADGSMETRSSAVLRISVPLTSSEMIIANPAELIPNQG